MSKDDIIAARLDLIAAKARILSEQYKNNKLWEGDLERGLEEIQREISAVRNNSSGRSGWAQTDDGQWGSR
jgi:hypothetical protein